MKFYSTRDIEMNNPYTSSQAILKGLGEDSGLFVPESIPIIRLDELENMQDKSYIENAEFIIGKYLTDFPIDDLKTSIKLAYGKSFSSENITPTHFLNNKLGVLELYHGPTSAFKDIALQILPHLLTNSARINNDLRTYLILVATSGDTGKAALEGFKDIPNTKILVFYPEKGVSNIQKLQMVTQSGGNVKVVAVKGNFDDTQSEVKQLFSNKLLNEKLQSKNHVFSSANSINWGRLVPQIVYYFQSYFSLLKNKSIKMGDKINFCVPTGNFGNILAGYFAKEMGLPVNKLICASNKNNVLTDFINTGIYDTNRDFHQTISPSMDILISSNLERLLYLLSDRNSEYISDLMNELSIKGKYEVTSKIKFKLKEIFYSNYCDDEKIIETIAANFSKYNYLIDTHTAVAMNVYESYKKDSEDLTPTIIVSTASPYKFNHSVAKAIIKNSDEANELELLNQINLVSKVEIPLNLLNLDQKKINFKDIISKELMKNEVEKFI